MIDEEQTTRNKSYWGVINSKRNTLSLSPRKRKEIEKAERIYDLLCKQPQSDLNEIPEQLAVKSSNARIN